MLPATLLGGPRQEFAAVRLQAQPNPETWRNSARHESDELRVLLVGEVVDGQIRLKRGDTCHTAETSTTVYAGRFTSPVAIDESNEAPT